MKERYIVRGIPSNVLHKDTRNLKAISVEDGAMHITKVKTFIGDTSNYEFLVPSSGKSICVKGLSMLGNGNTGIARLIRSSDGTTMFPAYFSAQVRSAPSGAFNFVLEPDEKILVTITDRGTNETFIGISYIEYDVNDFMN